MRTFNGLQIFTEQLTNSGQLDLRYVRISGNSAVPNLNAGVRIGGYNIPSSNSSIGFSGQLAWDQSHFYICVDGDGATYGTWARLSLENF